MRKLDSMEKDNTMCCFYLVCSYNNCEQRESITLSLIFYEISDENIKYCTPTKMYTCSTAKLLHQLQQSMRSLT